MNTLTNKVAVVTGASKGIGASIAKHLAAAGATVVVNYATSQAGADQVVSEICAAGGAATAVQGDFTKPEDIKALALFLASPASEYITGQEIIIDGGWGLGVAD